MLVGDRSVGEILLDDPRVELVSATGSVRMGREVGPRVAQRFGRSLLELGGNNAAIVAPSADADLALRGVVFAAAGTAGQRCTTLRRLFVHSSIAGEFVDKIVAAYGTLTIGSPLDDGVLVGPLVGQGAFESMQAALATAQEQGGEVLCGGDRVLAQDGQDAFYVEPAVVRMPSQTAVVHEETFAPILYVVEYDDLDDAIALNNAVPQGLSSAVFTSDLGEAERFLAGSDTGIANVNIGTSGAEIGGAFGGNKETGGGRESGTDSWQAYMRQATNTVNYSGELAARAGGRVPVRCTAPLSRRSPPRASPASARRTRRASSRPLRSRCRERTDRGGVRFDDGDQSRIGEHHVGRDLLLLRHGCPPLAQCLEHLARGRLERIGGTAAGPPGPAARTGSAGRWGRR